MSNPILKVRCDLYLIRYLETLYGSQPIRFPNGNKFNTFIHFNLRMPNSYTQESDYGEETLLLEIPDFKSYDVNKYCSFSERVQEIFQEQIRSHFSLTFETEMTHILLMQVRRRRKHAIELWMIKYNIPEESWDMLQKKFQRYLPLGFKCKVKKESV